MLLSTLTWLLRLSSSFTFPALTLSFTIVGEMLTYVTVFFFNSTIEVVTILSGAQMQTRGAHTQSKSTWSWHVTS